jgi:hypothetical protein
VQISGEDTSFRGARLLAEVPSSIRSSAAARHLSTRQVVVAKDLLLPSTQDSTCAIRQNSALLVPQRQCTRLIAGLSITWAQALRATYQVPAGAEKGVGAQLTVIQKKNLEGHKLGTSDFSCIKHGRILWPTKGMKRWLGGRAVVEAVGEIRSGAHRQYLHLRPRSDWTARCNPRVRSERDNVFIDEPHVRPCAPTHGGYSGSRMA